MEIRRDTMNRVLTAFLPALFLFSACALGPDFERPEAPPVQGYTEGPEPSATVAAEGQAQHFEYGAEIGAEWWQLFRSPELNSLIETAVAENQNLRAAQARLRQSRELLDAGYGPFFPQVDGTFSTTREKFSSARFGGSFPSVLFTLYTASASVSYTLDVFGRTRRTVEGLRAQAEYQDYEAKATYITLLGNVINTAIAQAGYRAQIKATEEIIDFEREQLRITKIQAQAGMVPESNVLNVQSQLASTEATLPPLHKLLSQSRHLLATLVGRMPAAWSPPAIDLSDLSLPSDLPVSLPSDLVRQRPDVLAAEAQLHVASAQIGVATAAMFPSISLSADYGQATTNASDLFKSVSNYWDYGGSITGPIFQGGSLWFQRKAAVAAHEEALATYRQTVLNAFAQVADALRALEYDALTLEAQAYSLKSAEESLRLVQENYKAGIASYLDLLNADRLYRQAKILYIQALVLRLQDTSALFVALGGGWWHAP
ncbi:MAG: efflux transporter outer membrane subunit [Deltaproteobacteria bacterium]